MLIITLTALGLATLIYWVFAFTIIYHLVRFGIGKTPKKLASVFLVGTVALFSLSILLFSLVDFRAIGHNLNLFNEDSIFSF